MSKINIRKAAVIANGEIILIELENMTCFLLGLTAMEIRDNRAEESISTISVVRLRNFPIGMILPCCTIRKPQIRFSGECQISCFDSIAKGIIYDAFQRGILRIQPQPDTCRCAISICLIHRGCAGDYIASDLYLVSCGHDLTIR